MRYRVLAASAVFGTFLLTACGTATTPGSAYGGAATAVTSGTTYNGYPLYTFGSDSAPGMTNGNGSGGAWRAGRSTQAETVAGQGRAMP
jgi:hypothetical protein